MDDKTKEFIEKLNKLCEEYQMTPAIQQTVIFKKNDNSPTK